MDNWQPVPGHILTRWAKEVNPQMPLPEYPRPQMQRREWLNLNGLWDYAITDRASRPENGYDGKILVPFPLESALSGVKKPLQPEELLWYRRKFTIPAEWGGRRILLHFGAVDWAARVWVNGKEIGSHRGGYLPFYFDITSALAPGENELVVSAWDSSDTSWQQRGKQVLQPKSIWYTAVSGIWQTVWLEPVPQGYIGRLKITPDIDSSTVTVEALNPDPDVHLGGLKVTLMDGDVEVTHQENAEGTSLTLSLPAPKLWSPASPYLYDLVVRSGEDEVRSYFGMRKFSVESSRLCVNHQPLFQLGPLDQGYYPDGLYTPPTDSAMRADVELVKNLGFNMLRKHVKVEPARYYYYCDCLGLIVWQDMPSGGAVVGDAASVLEMLFTSKNHERSYKRAGRAEEISRLDYERELQEMVDCLYSFPCIGMWVPFNEGWGQFDAKLIAEWLQEYDPTRPVDHASGWFDMGGGDCKSLHAYFKKLPEVRLEKRRAAVLSEFGGYSLKIDGHQWNPSAEFGYKKLDSIDSLTAAYLDLLENQLAPRIDEGLSAAIYTQTTDVEIEVNGYVTYDREVEKMDFRKVREAHERLIGKV